MVRSLDIESLRTPVKTDRRVASSTGRAIGAALACLLVTSLVVGRSIAAVHPGDAGSSGAFGAAAVALSDDDQGRSLINLSNMVPGRVHRSCINVTYEGTLVPVDLSLRAETSGPLVRFISLSVEQVATGSFDDCDSTVVERPVFSGSLSDLARTPVSLGPVLSSEETRTYRFEFEIADTAEAMGQVAGADFVWEISP